MTKFTRDPEAVMLVSASDDILASLPMRNEFKYKVE